MYEKSTHSMPFFISFVHVSDIIEMGYPRKEFQMKEPELYDSKLPVGVAGPASNGRFKQVRLMYTDLISPPSAADEA